MSGDGPIVTFTTDFGSADGYVGAMKGVVLSLAPNARVVDIAHGIPAQDVAAGAAALAQAAPLFPPGTIHVAVVDPGVGTLRAGIVVESAGAIFVGPDNGLLSFAAAPPRRAYRIASGAFRRDPVSPTFHGRDVFAPTAGRLAAGAAPADAGPPLSGMVEMAPAPIRFIDGRAEGVVTHVDTFGNLITSIPSGMVSPDHMVEVEAGDAKWRPLLGRTFADVAPGEMVAYVGSGGHLEIAVRDGSAAGRTGARRGSVVRLRSRS